MAHVLLHLEDELHGCPDAAGDGVGDAGEVLRLLEPRGLPRPAVLRLGPEQVRVRQHGNDGVEDYCKREKLRRIRTSVAL